jgi:hypothetical protein
MTSKKSTVIISAVLTILGVIAFTFLQFRLYRYLCLFENFNNRELLSLLKQYGLTISSGIFTSAFVTFLIARGDYLYERRESLENIYLESEEMQRAFMKIKYIFPDEPKELVRDLLGEIDSNESAKKRNKYLLKQLKNVEDSGQAQEIYDMSHSKITHDAEIRFKKYLWEHTDDDVKKSFTTPKVKRKYLDKECKRKIEKYDRELEEVMRSYITFDDVRTKELSSAYGNLNFIFANKSIRQHIFDNLYQKQIEQVKRIKNRIYYFNLYFEGNGAKKSLLFDWVWELQESLTSEDGNFYYRQYQYDIDREMTQILVYTYGKVNTEEIPQKKRYIITSKPDWMERMIHTDK